MSQLPESFRTRTKQYAASVVRFYVAFPKTQEEVIVLARQLFGTSVAAHIREAVSCSFRHRACLEAGWRDPRGRQIPTLARTSP